MIVMKFGGTSVANYEAITRMVSIVRGKLGEKPVVVVSALSKVTDLLYRISDSAAARNEDEAKSLLAQLRERHIGLSMELLADDGALCKASCDKVNEICDALDSFVSAVCAVGELSARSKAIIISNGEYLSSNIICFAMNAAGIRTNYMDARKMIITDADYMKGEPDMDAISAAVPGIVAEA